MIAIVDRLSSSVAIATAIAMSSPSAAAVLLLVAAHVLCARASTLHFSNMTNVVIILLAGATAFNVGILLGQGGSIWRKGFYGGRNTGNESVQYNEILKNVNLTEYCIEGLRLATSGDGTDLDTLVSLLQNLTSGPDGRRNITDGSRYYVELHLKLNFFQAMEYCARQGLRLATFDNEDDFNQLVRLLQDKTTGPDFVFEDGYESFFIGAQDLGQKGKYTWWPTGRELTYTNWIVGEPNNKQQTLRGVKYEEERCVVLMNEFKMNDVPCYLPRHFVCEDPLALY